MPTRLQSAVVLLAALAGLAGAARGAEPTARGDAGVYQHPRFDQAGYSVGANPPPSEVRPAMAYEFESHAPRPEQIMPVQFTVEEGAQTDPQNPSVRELTGGPPLKLSGPSSRRDGSPAGPTAPAATGSVVTVASSLAIVLGLFFALLWLAKKNMPRGMTAISSEVVKVLGRAPLSGRQQMHLVRIGNKLLLVSVTPNGAETLTEITDPQEVDHLTSLCEREQPGSVTRSFRNVLAGLGERAKPTQAAETPVENDPLVATEQATAGVSSIWEDRHGT